MMTFSELCRTLGFWESALPQVPAVMEEFAASGLPEFPFFLKKEEALRLYSYVGDDIEARQRIEYVCMRAEQEPALALYAALQNYAVYHMEPGLNLGSWLEPKLTLEENTGIFNLLVAMSAIPQIEETHRRLGIPADNIHAICRWLSGTVQIYAKAHDMVPGHTMNQTYWIRHHIDAKLFRIVRLEFMPQAYPSAQPPVYINKATGRPLALCRAGWQYDADGWRTNNPEKVAFTAELTVTEESVTGTPIRPDGKPCVGETRTLSLAEWYSLEDAPGICVGIHIPGGEPLTRESVRQSLMEAPAFIERYYGQKVKAFQCGSWLFNPEWQKYMPKSKIADFGRHFYATGTNVIDGSKPGFFFVYGVSTGDPRQLPCTTELNRAHCRMADEGGHFCVGYVFILPSDVDKYGTELYRKEWGL